MDGSHRVSDVTAIGGDSGERVGGNTYGVSGRDDSLGGRDDGVSGRDDGVSGRDCLLSTSPSPRDS